jgi:hypothetical protein
MTNRSIYRLLTLVSWIAMVPLPAAPQSSVTVTCPPPQCVKRTVPRVDCKRKVGGLYTITDSQCVARLRAAQQQAEAEFRACEAKRREIEEACKDAQQKPPPEYGVPPEEMP